MLLTQYLTGAYATQSVPSYRMLTTASLPHMAHNELITAEMSTHDPSHRSVTSQLGAGRNPAQSSTRHPALLVPCPAI